MTNYERIYYRQVEQTLDTLGLGRVKRAVGAFAISPHCSFGDCFVGLAYGEKDKLSRTKIQVDGKDRTIVDWVITSGPGAFRFDQLLRAVNMNELADKYRAGEQVPFDTEALVGQSLQIVVDKELDQKNPDLERNRVKSYLRA
jgi:hypothetical protein